MPTRFNLASELKRILSFLEADQNWINAELALVALEAIAQNIANGTASKTDFNIAAALVATMQSDILALKNNQTQYAQTSASLDSRVTAIETTKTSLVNTANAHATELTALQTQVTQMLADIAYLKANGVSGGGTTAGTLYGTTFPGNTYLSIAAGALYLPTDTFFIEARLKMASFYSYAAIIDQNTGGTNASCNFDFIVDANGKLRFEAYSGGSENVNLIASTALTANTDTVVGIEKNGSTYTLYKEGAVVGTATSAATLNKNAVATLIGRMGTGNYFNGTIASLHVRNDAPHKGAAYTPVRGILAKSAATMLLMCQAQEVKDYSDSSLAITTNGSVSYTAM